ncbi:uncharacterized protein [Anabrus simplex]
MSGIPEALHYKFQEEETVGILSEDRTVPGYHATMSEMPSSNNETGSGFNGEVLDLLNDWGLDVIVPCFKQHSVSLYEFLTLKDPDIRALGVNFTSDRKDILDVIKKFHMCKWQTLATFVMKPKKVRFVATDGLDIMSRLTQHFYIECATLAYLRSRFEDVVQRLTPKEKSAFLDALETNIVQAQGMIESLKIQMKALADEVREKARFEERFPADFIGPKQQSKWNKKYLTVAVISMIIVTCIVRSKVKDFPTFHFPEKDIL